MTNPSCSFCKTPANDCEILLQGPGYVHICGECLRAGMGQVAAYRRKNGWREVPTPNEAKKSSPSEESQCVQSKRF